MRACCGLGRISATMPPLADATIVDTTGRSQAAVMVSSLVSCTYMLFGISHVVARAWGLT